MKTLLLALIILALNGCGEPEPCKPVVCINMYPKLPTYKLPSSTKFSTEQYDQNNRIIQNQLLLELVSNNKRLRRICSNYAVVNKKMNEQYNK
ncbi:MAG: hypothetical protein J7L15_06280 [Clostridiales bacterium]|nr:hypothetical protein [Clostridiales bacterium]